jgi:hypothetical protein
MSKRFDLKHFTLAENKEYWLNSGRLMIAPPLCGTA